MKSKLILNNPLWQTAARRRILDKAVQASGIELEGEIKKVILTGPKTGRLYRRGAITKRASKTLLNLGLRRKAGRATRVIAGANFHRASAPGQAPANDSGNLSNSIRAKRSGNMKTRISAGAEYAAALDEGATIGGRSSRTKIAGPMKNRTIAARPFFKKTAEEFKKKFKQNISEVIKENS